jgi:hypothetical protein
MIYTTIEPFGEEAAFYRAGIVASTIANVHRDQKKRREPFAPTDFMPRRINEQRGGLKEVPEGLDPKRVKAEFIAAFGNRIKRKDKGDGGQG